MKNFVPDTSRRDALIAALLACKSKPAMEAFIADLCTPAEIEAMADRWVVAKMLADEIPYRQISDETGVSVATVTRVARCLHQPNSGYAQILDKEA